MTEDGATGDRAARPRDAPGCGPVAASGAGFRLGRAARRERGRGEIADLALLRLDVDRRGLDAMDRRYLSCIADNYAGGPVGVETLSAALSEQRDVLEEVIEPYLIQEGLLQRTPRGRMLAGAGYSYLGLEPPKEAVQLRMLEADTETETAP